MMSRTEHPDRGTQAWDGPDFRGAKIALIVGTSLITYQRDDKPDIPFPGLWDLPGGGREGDESPVACALREVEEEFGLVLDPDCIVAETYCPARTARVPGSYFLVGFLSPEAIAAIRFGSEGQRWAMMSFDAFMAHPEVIPHFKTRLQSYLDDCGQREASAWVSAPRTDIHSADHRAQGTRPGMRIRPAQVDDAEAACAVIRDSIVQLCTADHGGDPAILGRWLANKTPENVAAWTVRPDNSVLVAILDGRLASVGAVTDAGEITLNYVAPDARFRGVSRAMLVALEARACERGNTRCHLLSTETAYRFYLANGFKADGPPEGRFGMRGSHPMFKDLPA